MVLQGNMDLVYEDTVDTIADDDVFCLGLDMDITYLVTNRLEEDGIDKTNGRRFFRTA